jgi:hypothetical protein
MILFFQSQAPVEKDVSIPADDVLCKLSPYKQRWIEEDAMIKFQENSTVKAYQLSCGSLVYQKPRPEILRSCGPELEGWQVPKSEIQQSVACSLLFLNLRATSWSV